MVGDAARCRSVVSSAGYLADARMYVANGV